MTKNEFLDGLRRALNGQVPPPTVSQNLEYYRSYIATEEYKGRSEEEILEALGDPRLIARTIIDAGGQPSKSAGDGYDPYNGYQQYEAEADSSPDPQQKSGSSFHSYRLSKGWIFAIVFSVLFLFFAVLYFVFKAAFKLLFSFHGIWFWAILLVIIFNLTRRRQ